jgi:predicted alpha/beta-fold hydrolase
VAGGATVLNIGGIFATTASTRNLTTTLGTARTTVGLSFLIKPNETGPFDYVGVNFGATGSQLFLGYQGSNFVRNKAGGGVVRTFRSPLRTSSSAWAGRRSSC